MTKELALAAREEKVLSEVVHRQANDPVGRYFQRSAKGLFGPILVVVVFAVVLGAVLGFRMIVERFGVPILMFMLAIDAVTARWFQVPVREGLIRKLYSALEEQSGG